MQIKTLLRSKLVISCATASVLIVLIITLGLFGRGVRSPTRAGLSRFDPAKGFDTEQIARSCTPSVMLIVSEGGDEGLVQGTGFVVSPDGLLITNYHVINGGKRLAAKSYTGGTYPVLQVMATDPKHDIAVLKIEGKELPFLQLDESSKVHPGSKVAVIGNPIGLESSVTEGIVSAVRTVEEFGDVLQISAAISPGSSGSPVLNADGKVIGVATFKLLKGEALNFAIPSKHVAEVLVTANTIAATGNKAAPYSPNPLAKGSGEQGAKAAHDPKFAQAKTLEDKKDYFGMLKQAKALVSSYPDSALAYRTLSDGYYYVEMLEDSIAAAEKAIDLDPASPRGWDNLAILYRRGGDPSKAVQVFTYAVKLAPDDAKLLIDYAMEISKSNPRAARIALAHAQTLLSENQGVDMESSVYPLGADLVNALLRLNELQDAYQASREAISRNPNQGAIWEAYARAALAMKKFNEVRSALNRANELDMSREADHYVILGDSELEGGNFPLAVDAFQRAYNIRPNDPNILDGLIVSVCLKSTLNQEDTDALYRWLRELKNVDAKRGELLEKSVDEVLRKKRQ